jgi:hypothetical protein
MKRKGKGKAGGPQMKGKVIMLRDRGFIAIA